MTRPDTLFRFKRLPLTRVLATAAIASLCLAPAARAADVTRGGTITQAEWIAVPSLDPHLSSAVTTVVWPNLFDSLFHYTPPASKSETYEISPALAESFSYVGDDESEIEVKLREGVTFHDGSPLTAELVKWNLERARDNEQSTRKLSVEDLTGITVVDDHTLRLKFSTAQPLFDLQFSPANPANVYMVSRKAVEEMGDEAFGRAPVGSGPFKLTEFRTDDRIIAAKFADYWNEGSDGAPLPYADELVIRFMPDRSISTLELRAGTVDVTEPLPQDIKTLMNDPSIALYRIPYTDRGYPSFYITSNEVSKSPFATDARLRQAVQYALNRDAMAAVMGFGDAEPQYFWGWYPGVPGYDEGLPHYSYDPEKAKALLADAGHADGIDLEVKVINRPSDVQPLEVMQGMLSEVGINLKINLMDRTPWVDSGRTGNFEALSHGNTANIEPLLREQTKTGSSSNWAGYSNPEVDKLWEEAAAASTVEERVEIYKRMQTLMMEDAYHVVGYRIPTFLAYSAKLHGVEASGGTGMGKVWKED